MEPSKSIKSLSLGVIRYSPYGNYGSKRDDVEFLISSYRDRKLSSLIWRDDLFAWALINKPLTGLLVKQPRPMFRLKCLTCSTTQLLLNQMERIVESTVNAVSFLTSWKKFNSGPLLYNKGNIIAENIQALLREKPFVDAADITWKLSALQIW